MVEIDDKQRSKRVSSQGPQTIRAALGGRARQLLAVGALGLIITVLLAPTASADTTHPFLGYINIASGTDPQPIGVDHDGNLIVWLNDQKAVAKFDTNGNPVNFSGLGTNILDGNGGLHCPSTPSDCDRVPTEGFRASDTHNEAVYSGTVVAIDHSGGPADGYIYVENNEAPGGSEGAFPHGEIDVFDESGVFKGVINQAQAYPKGGDVDTEAPASAGPVYFSSQGISVSPDGVLYVIKSWHQPETINRYVPVDGDPTHDLFNGQTRSACADEGCFNTLIAYGGTGVPSGGVAAGRTEVYVHGVDQTHGATAHFMRYPIKEFFRQGTTNYAVTDDYSPSPGPFDNSDGLEKFTVDPANEHVYVAGGWAGIKEWDPNNQQVGPMFGAEGCPGSTTDPFPFPNCRIADGRTLDTIGLDRSGGPTDGRIYVKGPAEDQIAVFGPPVKIPDINSVSATALHATAHVSAEVALAGGPVATDCDVEYGPSVPYEYSVPCDPPTPYATDTSIGADLSGLVVGGEYHYRVVVKSANGTNTTADHVFETHAVLAVTTEDASALDPTSASLNGSLDPDGMATEYHFDFGISTDYAQKTPKVTMGAGSGVTRVAPAQLTGLQTGRIYHYRLVAKNSLGTTKGADHTLLVPGTPRILSVRATDVANTSAELHAEINPVGFDTSYHFEYGITPSYGQSLPSVDIGDGSSPQAVAGPLSNLETGVTYHFRVVATNKWGTAYTPDTTFTFVPQSCPNSHIRQQTSATYLPDCRAYELVSPGNAGPLLMFPGGITNPQLQYIFSFLTLKSPPNAYGQASSPARFGFFGYAGAITGLHPPNGLIDRYVSTRTTDGWVTTFPGRTGDQTELSVNPLCSMSMDKCIDYQTSFLTNTPSSEAPFVWNVDGSALGRWPTNLDVVPHGTEYIGDKRPSPDFSHFVFSSRNVPFAAGGLDTSPGSVYDNEIASNTVRIASTLPSGEPIPKDAGPSDEYIKIPAVSTDGSHILMSTVAPGSNVHLYMRVDGRVSYDITNGAAVKFVGMTADGSKVVFTSAAQLTPDDTDLSVDMFSWSEATDTITRVSQGNGNGNSDTCTAQWTGLCDVSALSTARPDLDDAVASGNGSVYFYSPEQLDPANPGVLNERNLYLYRDGHVHYVTTFEPHTQVDRVQMTPDGSRSAFLTTARLTNYDNSSPNYTGHLTAWEEMYTYDDETGGIVCASCIPTGEPPTINYLEASGSPTSVQLRDVMASTSGRFMSDDGRVVFATADRLVPADTNGKIDVYEFTENRPQLITTGTGDRDMQSRSLLYPSTNIGVEGISADGVDIYFSTFQTLVPQDGNGSFVKFYDARAGGGFPYTPSSLPCAAADECHGDASIASPEPQVGTGADLGASAVSHTSKGKTHKKHRHRRGVKRHHHRSIQGGRRG
jgi:hypothetical protein